jgi:photosystem II stability/assembly factor-like uncharacterized protein
MSTHDNETRGRGAVDEQSARRRLTDKEWEEGEGLRRRMDWIQGLLGTDDVTRVLQENDRFRGRRPTMRPQGRATADPYGPLPESGQDVVSSLPNSQANLRVTRCESPDDFQGFGRTGVCVEVAAAQPFASARVRFKLQQEQISHLHPGSIAVARWDNVAERFSLVPQSGFNVDYGYAYARISQPGIYTAIGLPRDPRLLTTLKLFAAVDPWLHDREIGKRIIDRICQVVLCADFLRDPAQDAEWLPALGLTQQDFVGAPGGSICDQCLGADAGRLPELDLLEVAELPDRVINPDIHLLPIWPLPCPSWHNVGPVNVTGRVGALVIIVSGVLMAGTTGGGVWLSFNDGSTWTPLMSNELSLAVGGLGSSPSDPSVLYAATGEWTAGIGAPVDPVTKGVGVYRTTNSGADWDLCASIPSDMCSAVAVDPWNARRVFVGGNTGLHRSADGGVSWDIPLGRTYGVFDGEVSDVVIDPDDVDRLYIGVHRDGVHRSTDGGNTWFRLQNGIDTGAVADSPKIALGRDGAHGTQFVAVKMGQRVYTSVDGGTTFTRRADVGGAIWYFAWTNAIAVDPTNEDVLLAGAVDLYRSTDGGATWSFSGAGVHSDNQSIAFDPDDHDHCYVATDGGIWKSEDNGVSWAFTSRGLVATHFYNMAVSDVPTLRYGGAIQDDSGFQFVGAPDWSSLDLGEGGYLEYDPNNQQVMYHDTWSSDLNKTTAGGPPSWASLGIQTDLWYGEPLAIGRTNTNLLLAIVNGTSVSRSTNGGSSWTSVLAPGGVSFTSVRFAPSNDQEAYAGTSDARIWHSQNSGTSWTELDTTALPVAQIQSLVVAPTDPHRVYVAFAGTGIRHLFRGDLDATGVNVTWFDVSGALSAVSLPDLPLTGLALHPALDEVIYVSTLLGVLRSVDGGDSWVPFDDGLPNAFVSDLDIRTYDRSLWASTMGRGIYRRYI